VRLTRAKLFVDLGFVMETVDAEEFETGPPNLVYLGTLIKGVKSSKLALPEFQRSQVWSANEKKELIVSMCLGIPIGSFLLWEYEDVKVHRDTELRAFPEQVLDKGMVKYLLIDGQQRLSFLSNLADSDFADLHYIRFVETKNQDNVKSVRPFILKYPKNKDGELNKNINPANEISLSELAGIGEKSINKLDDVEKKMAKQFRKSMRDTVVPCQVYDTSRDRRWVVFVYQTSNLAGKALAQEDYAAAAFSYLMPDFADKLAKFLSEPKIKRYETKLNRKVFIRAMLDHIYSDTSFSGCRKKGLDMLNLRVIETPEDLKNKVAEESDPLVSDDVSDAFQKVKNSFSQLAYLFKSKWCIHDKSVLMTNEILMMSAWYRHRMNGTDVEATQNEIGEMSKWMLISMAIKATTGGSTQQKTNNCCNHMRLKNPWPKIIEELNLPQKIEINHLGNLKKEVSKGLEKSNLGAKSILFEMYQLSVYRNGGFDIFSGDIISPQSRSNIQLDHFYPRSKLAKIPGLKLRRDHMANIVLMKEWKNNKKKAKWPNLIINEHNLWPKSDTKAKNNFDIHCIPKKPDSSWVKPDVEAMYQTIQNQIKTLESAISAKESESKIKKFESDLEKSVETFEIGYRNFLHYRAKRMAERIDILLEDISVNGF